jgi:hypothetical protein
VLGQWVFVIIIAAPPFSLHTRTARHRVGCCGATALMDLSISDLSCWRRFPISRIQESQIHSISRSADPDFSASSRNFILCTLATPSSWPSSRRRAAGEDRRCRLALAASHAATQL